MNVDLRSEKASKAWFNTHTIETCTVLSGRAVLRALPGLALNGRETLNDSCHHVMRHALRAIIAEPQLIHSQTNGPDMAWACLQSSEAVLSCITAGDPGNAAIMLGLGHAWLMNGSSAVIIFEDTGGVAELGSHWKYQSQREKATRAFEKDLFLIDGTSEILTPVQSQSLWHDVGTSPEFRQAHSDLVDFFEAEPEVWAFWKRWYLAMHDGTWRDWDLARDVALIPDDVWEQGAAAVAEAIRATEARQDLKRRIGELETAFSQGRFNRHGIGGNHPPEILNEPPEIMNAILAGFAEIHAEVQSLKTEISGATPDPKKIEASAESLTQWAERFTSWLGGVATKFFNSAAQVTGAGAGAYLLGLTPDIPTLIDNVARAARVFATLLW